MESYEEWEKALEEAYGQPTEEMKMRMIEARTAKGIYDLTCNKCLINCQYGPPCGDDYCKKIAAVKCPHQVYGGLTVKPC